MTPMPSPPAICAPINSRRAASSWSIGRSSPRAGKLVLIYSAQCPLRSESDRIAAPQRHDAMCQKETHAAQQRSRTDLSLFDHFVGDGEQAGRNCQSKPPGGLEIDHKLELSRLQNGQVGRLLALEDSASIDTGLTKRIESVWAVAHESASRYEFAPDIGGGNPVARRQRNKLGAPIVEKWIGGNDQGIDVLLIYGSESSLEVAFAAGIQDMNLAPERVDRRFQFCELRLADRIMW